MHEITKEDILQYLKEIKPYFKQKGISSLALFGSYTKNDTNIYSDIDIAIKKETTYLKSHQAYEYFTIINELKNLLIQKFKKPVDILDIDSQSPFISHIEKEIIYV